MELKEQSSCTDPTCNGITQFLAVVNIKRTYALIFYIFFRKIVFTYTRTVVIIRDKRTCVKRTRFLIVSRNISNVNLFFPNTVSYHWSRTADEIEEILFPYEINRGRDPEGEIRLEGNREEEVNRSY